MQIPLSEVRLRNGSLRWAVPARDASIRDCPSASYFCCEACPSLTSLPAMPVTNLPPPNRRQRRAAERYVKRHGLSGPAPRGPHPQDYSALVRALDVPPDGLGADILRVTAELARVQTEFSASTDYDTIKAERNAVWRSYDFENTLADGLRRWRECNHKMGAMCESCGNMRCVPADMKRCTRVRHSIVCRCMVVPNGQ